MNYDQDVIQLSCAECGRPFEEGLLIYSYDNMYFCSPHCMHSWIDSQACPQEYYRENYKYLLDY